MESFKQKIHYTSLMKDEIKMLTCINFKLYTSKSLQLTIPLMVP